MVNFGPLTPEFTVMVWRPFTRQMDKIGERRSILGTRIRQWMAGWKGSGRINIKEVLPTSCKNLVNFGPLGYLRSLR